MSDYARGIATFNSCDKAGSIPFFTRHLDSHPDDYQARRMRARAYGIVGDDANCLADLQIARERSTGVQKMMIDAEIERMKENAEGFFFLLQTIVNVYPHHAAGWHSLALIFYNAKRDDEALQLLHKAVKTAEEYDQTELPEYPWDNNFLGDVYYRKGNLDLAEKYYKTAINVSSTLTVAHIGLGRVYLCESNLGEARKCYDTARGLNPKLAHWETFEAFRQEAEAGKQTEAAIQITETKLHNQSANKQMAQRDKGKQGKSGQSDGKESSKKPTDRKEKGKKGKSGQSDGNDSDSGNDDKNKDDNDTTCAKTWAQLLSAAQAKALYRRRVLVLSKCGKYWYSKDTARHGGAHNQAGGCCVKVYKNKSNELVFLYAADKNMKPILAKHESHEGEVIKKRDLNMKFRK